MNLSILVKSQDSNTEHVLQLGLNRPINIK